MDTPQVSRRQLMGVLLEQHLNQDRLVLKALNQAIKSHGSQKRDDGSDYLEQHVYPIVITVLRYCFQTKKNITARIIAGALLHDVLEDDITVTVEWFEETFGKEVLDIVVPLTKLPLDTYEGKSKTQRHNARNDAYMAGLKNAPVESRIIKLADRLNNLQCLHTTDVPGKKQLYIRESKKYYLPLAKEFPWFLEKLENVLDALR
jgi:GTP pyrophosphokinase